MKKEVIVKGKATKETFTAIEKFSKTGDESFLTKVGKVLREGSKLILL